MDFEWDAEKTEANEREHKVAFSEASTVFGDPLAVTFSDPDHSLEEYTFLTFGVCWPDRRNDANERYMKMAKKDELRAEYVREDLGEGIRGKYYQRYQEGTNLILLDPDVAAAFPTSESVNQALRSLIEVARRSTRVRKQSTGTKKRA